jgi:hypothetical protein
MKKKWPGRVFRFFLSTVIAPGACYYGVVRDGWWLSVALFLAAFVGWLYGWLGRGFEE